MCLICFSFLLFPFLLKSKFEDAKTSLDQSLAVSKSDLTIHVAQVEKNILISILDIQLSSLVESNSNAYETTQNVMNLLVKDVKENNLDSILYFLEFVKAIKAAWEERFVFI